MTNWKKRPLDEKRLVCIHLQAFTVGKSSESYNWLVHMDTADIYNGYSQQVLSIMSVLQKPPVAQDTCVSEQEVLECWIVCHVDAKARPYTLGLCQKLTLHTCHMQLLSERLGFAAWNSSSFMHEDRTDQNAGSNGLFFFLNFLTNSADFKLLVLESFVAKEAPSHGTDLQGPLHRVVLLLLPESRTEPVML